LFFAGQAREEGFKQFLDDKTYKSGFAVYKKRGKKQDLTIPADIIGVKSITIIPKSPFEK
jgi:hypothetical protein